MCFSLSKLLLSWLLLLFVVIIIIIIIIIIERICQSERTLC